MPDPLRPNGTGSDTKRPNKANDKANGKKSSQADLSTISPVRLALFTYGLPLIFVGGVLVFAARLFTITAAEALTINAGAQPFAVILSQFRAGLGLRQTPALYALGLHVYLFLSAGALAWLRAPSALCFAAGLWFLSRAARRWGEGEPAAVLLLIAALWPYGFHYGALADSYSFAFLLICALILCYLRFGESPSIRLWATICALAAALVYTSYLGWAVLAFLGVSDWLRSREQRRPAAMRLLSTSVLVAAAYAPLWPAFARDVSLAAHSHQPWRQLALTAAYNLYVLLASESVAPWFWRFAAPVALAIVVGLVVALVGLRGPARRFLLFGLGLIVLMDLAGSLEPNRLLLVAPWFLLPLAVALGTLESKLLLRALLAALVVIGVVGWYGAFARNYYAVADFFEPWDRGLDGRPGLAPEVAGALRQGAGLISSSDPLFLYVTYALAEPPAEPGLPWRYMGSLPQTVQDPHIWSGSGWDAAGQPILPYMLWIRGVSSPAEERAMDDAAKVLGQRCAGQLNRFLVRNPAYAWEQRFFPQRGAEPWLIEIHQYACEGFPGLPTASAAKNPPAR